MSTPLLANYEVHLFEDTGDFASEVASMPVGTVTDCAELDDELSSYQSRISYLLSRLAKAANFLEANAGTLTDGAIEAYSSFSPTTSNDTNDIDKIFQGTLVAPSSFAHGEPCVTSVLVQFANEDDQHEVTGWSPLLIAWPSGRVAQARMANDSFTPPSIGDYDVTITACNYLFDLVCEDEDADIDSEDVVVAGDTYCIFKIRNNLRTILRLAYSA